MIIVRLHLKHSITLSKKAAVLLSILSTLSLGVQAQTENQISYPVALPLTQVVSTSSTAVAITPKAPVPIIRPIKEASVPPVTAAKVSTKNSAKKTTAPTVKTVTTSVKKTKTTTSAPIKTIAVKKERVITTPVKKTVVKPVAPAKPTVVPAKVAPQVAAIVQATKPMVVASSVVEPPKAPLIEPANLDAMYEEEKPSSSAEVTDETDSDEAPEVVSAVPVKSNSALPMTSLQSGFVREFKNYVATHLAPNVPGLAVAVIANGKVEVLEAYGVKKAGSSEPITTDTAFRLASVSKTIAGTAAGVLVNDGLIRWDTPINSVLPNVQFNNARYGNQLTLRNILSQSTGLPSHAGDNYIEEGMPYDDVVEKISPVNFVCPPGKCYAYQNVTFSLLSNIVLKKTGIPYEQYVKEKLFVPLGMRSASVGMKGLLDTNNYALPHVMTGRGRWYTEKITEHYYRLNPAAGANASISDMSHWVLAHMGHNPQVLSPATLSSVHAKITKNTPAQSHYGAREGVSDTHYGIGWRTFDYRGDKNFLHHGGYVLGYRSEMVFNPELQIGMVILSNCNKMPGSIIFNFLDYYEDEKRGEKSQPASKPVAKKKK